MGKSKKRKASKNASSDASQVRCVNTTGENAVEGQNKSLPSIILSVANNVLYGSPNKSSEEVRRTTPLSSTPKTGCTGCAGSTDHGYSTHNHNLEIIIGTVAETNRKLNPVLKTRQA
jgi:hypothetical protein